MKENDPKIFLSKKIIQILNSYKIFFLCSKKTFKEYNNYVNQEKCELHRI